MSICDESKHHLENFSIYLEIERNFSEHTIRSYHSDILSFLIFLDEIQLEDVKVENIKQYLVFINGFEYNKTTVTRKISAIRMFFKFLLREEVVSFNPVLPIKAPKRQKRLPEFLTDWEINKILNNISISTPVGFRNRTIFEVLYATGMRVSELCGLNFGNLNLDANEIKVFGKGSKERIVLISNTAKSYLETYIKTVREMLFEKSDKKPSFDSPIFVNNTGFRLQPQSVRKILKNLVKEVGIEKNVTPHKFRHSFATRLLENGADLRIVQELLGHCSISNTQIYTHISPNKLKTEYERFHPLVINKKEGNKNV